MFGAPRDAYRAYCRYFFSDTAVVYLRFIIVWQWDPLVSCGDYTMRRLGKKTARAMRLFRDTNHIHSLWWRFAVWLPCLLSVVAMLFIVFSCVFMFV